MRNENDPYAKWVMEWLEHQGDIAEDNGQERKKLYLAARYVWTRWKDKFDPAIGRRLSVKVEDARTAIWQKTEKMQIERYNARMDRTKGQRIRDRQELTEQLKGPFPWD